MYANIKILALTVFSKMFYIVLCGLASGGIYLLTDSLLISMTIGFTLFVILYFWLFGQIIFVTKDKIAELVRTEVITATNLNIVNKSTDYTHWLGKNWVKGMGAFNKFQDLYETNYSVNGIAFVCNDIPYLKLHFIPWENIKNISKESPSAKEENELFFENSRDITLCNGEVITLPLSLYVVDNWKILNKYQGVRV